jgi:hypothetical protein
LKQNEIDILLQNIKQLPDKQQDIKNDENENKNSDEDDDYKTILNVDSIALNSPNPNFIVLNRLDDDNDDNDNDNDNDPSAAEEVTFKTKEQINENDDEIKKKENTESEA